MNCKNCGELTADLFKPRKNGYFPNVCYECEKKQARDRRKRDYNDPVLKQVIKDQNKAYRARSSSPTPGSLDDHPWMKDIIKSGYLPPNEDLSDVVARLKRGAMQGSLIPQSYCGTHYLDHINPHRFSSRTEGAKSFDEYWNDPGEMLKVAEYMEKSKAQLDKKAVIRNVAFNVKMPSHFLPESATALYKQYAVGEDVLDPFIGWGGRCLGALVAGVKTYTGCDLSSPSVLGAIRISREMSSYSQSGVELSLSDFADWYIQNRHRRFGFIFTSPPFLDTEDYGTGGSSSTVGWNDKILLPLMHLCRELRKPGAPVAIHVQDRPMVPVLSMVVASFTAGGFKIATQLDYGRKSGQKVLVFQ